MPRSAPEKKMEDPTGAAIASQSVDVDERWIQVSTDDVAQMNALIWTFETNLPVQPM
jgi:hypothetical protein